MQAGALTAQFDVAQLVLIVFVLFFVGLIIHLRRENRREGFPTIADGMDGGFVQGNLFLDPRPKVFRLPFGGIYTAPRNEVPDAIDGALATGLGPGMPIEPVGNPMLSRLGPAAWQFRHDAPDLTFEGIPKIVPLRAAPGYFLAEEDPNPVGMEAVCADGRVAGVVADAWVDRSETLVRYLEIAANTAGGTRNVLVPMTLVKISGKRNQVTIESVMSSQLADAPVPKQEAQISLLEEDQICAYFGSGHLYATADRMGPVL